MFEFRNLEHVKVLVFESRIVHFLLKPRRSGVGALLLSRKGDELHKGAPYPHCSSSYQAAFRNSLSRTRRVGKVSAKKEHS